MKFHSNCFFLTNLLKQSLHAYLTLSKSVFWSDRRIVIHGVVCFSLSELGDCNLVLILLHPRIQQEFVSFVHEQSAPRLLFL